MSLPEETPTRALLRRLLAERGITRYALFLLQQEGRELPGGLEAVSGFVLTPEGEVHGFWLDWDAGRGGYTLDPWYWVENGSEFEADREYRAARRELASSEGAEAE